MIRPAPAIFAALTVARPTPPQPTTATVSPGVTLQALNTAPAPVVTAPAAEQGPVRLTVRQAQQRLVDKGYDAGVVDGIWGPRTANALRQFQRDQGLMATGRLDGETMNALGR